MIAVLFVRKLKVKEEKWRYWAEPTGIEVFSDEIYEKAKNEGINLFALAPPAPLPKSSRFASKQDMGVIRVCRPFRAPPPIRPKSAPVRPRVHIAPKVPAHQRTALNLRMQQFRTGVFGGTSSVKAAVGSYLF